MSRAVDIHEHLFEILSPGTAPAHAFGMAMSDYGGKDRIKPLSPATDRPMLEIYAKLVQQVLEISQR